MKFSINSQEIESNKVTYRQLGFGEHLDNPLKYKLRISQDELCLKFQQSFNDFVSESKSDDEEADACDSIPELILNNYPMFDEMIANHTDDLCEMIKSHLFFEFLDSIFTNSVTSDWDFAVNSMDEFLFFEGNFIINGTAYSI